MRTAISLMGEEGYEGTSTRDIAAAAGVSVAALYYHFPSKLDLLREFLTEAHDVVLARLGRNIEEAGADPRKRLDVAVETIIASNMHDEWAQRAAQVAWRESGRLAARDQKAIAAKREAMVDLIEEVVAELGSPEPKEVARAILTLCVSVVDPLSGAPGPMPEVIERHQRFAALLSRRR
jgi:AcrR family transcriptional regulator